MLRLIGDAHLMLRSVYQCLRALREAWQLPAAAKRMRRNDKHGLPARDPGIEAVLKESIAWLGRAQECSASRDGGVARDYSLIKGWNTSYPETTGYIVDTLIDYGKRTNDTLILARATRMLNWLTSIQLDSGAFQGGRIDSTPVVPVTFNTGQILLGLAAGVRAFNAYHEPMQRAADWLANTQDDDGCWRRFPTPFAAPGEKAYETHVAWGLMEAARLQPERAWGERALKNVRWALAKQRDNGWIDDCCLSDPTRPLTHTLGYALRGIVEAYRFSGKKDFLAAACCTADGLLTTMDEQGRLPGRLDASWQPAADWVCLTGSAQIAHSWLLLYRETGEEHYRNAAFAANRYVRRTVQVEGPDETRGGVKGSFPVNGDYGSYEYLNWAVKFCIDSNLLEQDIREQTHEAGRTAAG
jgi:hypothetical protein